MEQESIDKIMATVLKVWEAIKEFVQRLVKDIAKEFKQCKPLRRACMRQ